MSIQAISSTNPTVADKTVTKSIKIDKATAPRVGTVPVSTAQAMATSMKEEAQESLTETRSEAAKGDVQAIRKLAKMAAQAVPQPTEPVTPESTGTVVNVRA